MEEITGWLTPEVGVAMRNLILKVKPSVCVEIGVFYGKSLINTALALKENGVGMVYGIDPWRAKYAVAGMPPNEDESYWGTIDWEAVHRDCMRSICQHDLENVVIIRSTSELAEWLFHPASVDILYIDGGHAENIALQDAELYFPKVKLGGHVWLDDTDYESLQKTISFMRSQCVLVKDFGRSHLYRKQYEMV